MLAPSIILAIARPWLCVLGGVYLQRAVVQPLTDYVGLGGDAFNADRLGFSSRLFTALKSAIATLRIYYRSSDLSKTDVHNEIPDPSLFIQEYKSKKFTYLSRLTPEYSYKLAKLDNHLVIVKFVSTYHAPARRLLAEHGLAPLLLYAGTEHARGLTYGGRYMVVMDFVDGEPPVDSLSKGQLAQVKQTIDLLHSHNLVFGDLRASSILVKDESVMFVEFDWCGKARGAVALNSDFELGWPVGVEPDSVMLKEHNRPVDVREAAVGLNASSFADRYKYHAHRFWLVRNGRMPGDLCTDLM